MTEPLNSQSRIKEGLMSSYPSCCTIGSWWILWVFQAPMDIPPSLVTQMALIKISGPQKHMDMEKGFGQWKGNNRDVKESRVGRGESSQYIHAGLKSSKTKYIVRAFKNKDRKYPVKWGSLHTPLTNRFSFYYFYYCQWYNTQHSSWRIHFILRTQLESWWV